MYTPGLRYYIKLGTDLSMKKSHVNGLHGNIKHKSLNTQAFDHCQRPEERSSLINQALDHCRGPEERNTRKDLKNFKPVQSHDSIPKESGLVPY